MQVELGRVDVVFGRDGLQVIFGILLPASLEAKHKAMADRYSNMPGTAFDRAYMRNMVGDHTMDVARFQKEADGGLNPDLKTLAGLRLPWVLRVAGKPANPDASTTFRQTAGARNRAVFLCA